MCLFARNGADTWGDRLESERAATGRLLFVLFELFKGIMD